jgi:class 3 adenylate cyclase/CHASE2 domain-containing sensor protein
VSPVRRWLTQLPVFLGSAAAGLLLLALPRANPIERFALDARFAIAAAAAPPMERSADIAIVLMDEATETALGVPYGSRWRAFHPALLSILKEAGAALVVFDVEFPGEEPDLDADFAAAVRTSGNVIAGESRGGSTIPGIRAALLDVGSLAIREYGGAPREVISGSPDDGSETLSVCIVRHFRGGGPAAPRFWIDYRLPPRFFPTFSYLDVLRAADGRIADADRTPLSLFRGRIVLLGRDIPGGDRFPLPSSPGRPLAGVTGHAYAVHTLLSQTPVRALPAWLEAAAVVGLALALTALLGLPWRAIRIGLLVLLPLAGLVAAELLLSRSAVWVRLTPLAAAFAAALVLHWIARRRALSRALSRTMGFSAGLIEAFRREQARAGGHLEREVCVLVADVRDYTRFVSSHESRQVATVMGEYVSAIEGVITSQGGYVNKYVGDEVVAVFGFPLSDERREERAVAAARQMLRAVETLRRSWAERGVPAIERIGIGLDRGPATFAEVGGRTKSQFDIIGNCINGASRLQTLTKTLETALVISEEMHRALTANPGLQAAFTRIGETAIRGQGTRMLYVLAPEIPA